MSDRTATKQCRECDHFRPLDRFYPRRGAESGICIDCDNRARSERANRLNRRRREFIERAVTQIPKWIIHLPPSRQREARSLLRIWQGSE